MHRLPKRRRGNLCRVSAAVIFLLDRERQSFMARAWLGLERADVALAGVAKDGRRTAVNRVGAACFGSGSCGDDSCRARTSLREVGPRLLCSTTGNAHRALRFESGYAKRPTELLRAHRVASQADANCRVRASRVESSRDSRCVSVGGVVVVQTNCGSREAAVHRTALLRRGDGVVEAAVLS